MGITVDRGATTSAPGSSGSSGQSLNRRSGAPTQPTRPQGSNLAVINPAPCSTSSGLFFSFDIKNFIFRMPVFITVD